MVASHLTHERFPRMTRHLRLTPLFGLLLLLSAEHASAQEGAGATANNYYPLQAGNEWTFKVTVGGNSVTAISRIAKIEKIDDLSLSRLEASINDKIIATEHLNQTKEGIFRHRNNGQEITPPICLLKYPVKAGAKWEGPITVGKDAGKYAAEATEEEVEVPAGKFKALKVAIALESNKQKINTTYWFVKDLGFVKQTVVTAQLNILMELEKSSLAKQEKK